MYNAPWDWGPWHMWGGWGFWWIMPLLMFGFIAFCMFFMMRGMSGHGPSDRDGTASALRILNERFAKGEISKEELEEKKSILGRGP